MITKFRHPRTTALAVANEMVELLSPFVERIAIAGSIRRNKPECSDAEILYIAKTEDRTKLGELFQRDPNSLYTHDLTDEFLGELLASGILSKRPNVRGTMAWGPLNKLAIHVASGIPVDLFATSFANWWTALVIRTGGAETNKSLAVGAIRRGRRLLAYGCGVSEAGQEIQATSEEHLFELCSVPFAKPEARR
jgi:DNA polymerase/3'-5' exonuclease PolX